MEKLIRQSNRRIQNTKLDFKRYLHEEIDWRNRMIAIKGARGVGKTTLLLQHIKQDRRTDGERLYISLDDLYFHGNTLVDLVEDFYNMGGKYLYLDEVHKYENWSTELKNIYDNYDDLQVVFTSSSLLELNTGDADLSRRAVFYTMRGLSFREYLEFEGVMKSQPLELEQLLRDHTQIAQELTTSVKILPHFKRYLEHGYYPFYKENEDSYYKKLNQVINLTLETDIPAVFNTEYRSIHKIKRLLYLLSTALPYIPNIAKLSEQLETTSRNTTLLYLDYLEKANLTSNLKTSGKGNNYMVKPDKIYLENPNLIQALSEESASIGTVRETFFNNQLGVRHQVNTSSKSDFLVDERYTFEIGGKGKTTRQIQDIHYDFVAADGIEVGFRQQIPLWLFGFTY